MISYYQYIRNTNYNERKKVTNMNEELKKAKRLVIILFLSCMAIALACFGIFAYIVFTSRSIGLINTRIVTISKIIVLVGIFFLILAFGYLLPLLISHKKKEQE